MLFLLERADQFSLGIMLIPWFWWKYQSQSNFPPFKKKPSPWCQSTHLFLSCVLENLMQRGARWNKFRPTDMSLCSLNLKPASLRSASSASLWDLWGPLQPSSVLTWAESESVVYNQRLQNDVSSDVATAKTLHQFRKIKRWHIRGVLLFIASEELFSRLQENWHLSYVRVSNIQSSCQVQRQAEAWGKLKGTGGVDRSGLGGTNSTRLALSAYKKGNSMKGKEMEIKIIWIWICKSRTIETF